jgi:hypothetical protein
LNIFKRSSCFVNVLTSCITNNQLLQERKELCRRSVVLHVSLLLLNFNVAYIHVDHVIGCHCKIEINILSFTNTGEKKTAIVEIKSEKNLKYTQDCRPKKTLCFLSFVANV